ncbi:hypothetical protein SCLCIDRAFT_1220780 [Scleroderma citrinum Foug A]|uniref:Uncharacterized protein n=1 Tax=Scleroderma citrinum Foug A TaxID=1036808 RepID=A0A0C3DIP9_9AGAM|nr:hypothetical protein SCLCIDRAFT_1220780 [Scleroderma citrinum Foug A]
MWSMLIMIRNKANAETKDAKCDTKYTTQNEKAKGKDMSITAPPRPNCDPIDPSTHPHQRDTATQEKTVMRRNGDRTMADTNVTRPQAMDGMLKKINKRDCTPLWANCHSSNHNRLR